MGEGCQEHLGEGFSAGFLPAAAPWLALQLPPGSVPDSCGQQKGQEIRMAQAQPQAGLEEINPTPQPTLMGSQTSSNSSYPKPILQEKEQPQTMFSPNPGH